MRRWTPVAMAAAMMAAALYGAPGTIGQVPDDLLLLTLAPPSHGQVEDPSAPGLRIALGDSRGGEPTLLSDGFWEARSPSASFDGRYFLFQGKRNLTDPASIWERRITGNGGRRITDGNGDPDDPAYLPDGRIVYSDRAEDGDRLEPRALFTCSEDGSDARRLTYGRYLDRRPEVLPDGRIRFERRPLDAEPLSEPSFMTVRPDGTGIAAWAGDPCECDHAVPDSVTAGELGGDVLSAHPAAPRVRPPILTSVVREEVATGTLLCLNVYESRLPGVATLPAGSIRQVRVSAADPQHGERFVALAPVHADGSFLIEVAADTPIGLELLGDREQVLAESTSGFWVRPNENRGCIGCHERPEIAPVNRVPLAVSVASGAGRDGAIKVRGRGETAASDGGDAGER